MSQNKYALEKIEEIITLVNEKITNMYLFNHIVQNLVLFEETNSVRFEVKDNGIEATNKKTKDRFSIYFTPDISNFVRINTTLKSKKDYITNEVIYDGDFIYLNHDESVLNKFSDEDDDIELLGKCSRKTYYKDGLVYDYEYSLKNSRNLFQIPFVLERELFVINDGVAIERKNYMGDEKSFGYVAGETYYKTVNYVAPPFSNRKGGSYITTGFEIIIKEEHVEILQKLEQGNRMNFVKLKKYR